MYGNYMIEPTSFQEAQCFGLPNIDGAVFAINKLIRRGWQGHILEIADWELNLDDYWVTDCGLGRIKQAYESAGRIVKITQGADESITLTLSGE